MEFECLKLSHNNPLTFQIISMDFGVDSLQLFVNKLIKHDERLYSFVQSICLLFINLAIYGLFLTKIINKF